MPRNDSKIIEMTRNRLILRASRVGLALLFAAGCNHLGMAQEAAPAPTASDKETAADLSEMEALADQMNEKPTVISGKRQEKRRLQQASWRTNSDARAFLLQIPAPRGMLLDRNGVPLATNEVRYLPAIQFPKLDDPSDAEIVEFARKRIAEIARILKMDSSIGDGLEDEAIIKHYNNRRWLPLTFGPVLNLDQAEKVAAKEDGLSVQPFYMRKYPHQTIAAHMLGYTGRVGWFPDGPVEEGDPLWEQIEGKAGLELNLENDLKGKDGVLNVLFDENGKQTNRELTEVPVPGNNVVLTIDLEWQKRAEQILARNVRRGAIVVMDVKTGEILTMASYPTYNPNDWIPTISQEKYQRLRDDKANPLLCRAYQSAYPPASTFKIVVALAALQSRSIYPHSTFPGPPTYAVGNRVFKNWNKEPEGDLDVAKAIARSTNTWFYHVGIMTGAEPIYQTAQRFGLGRKVGLPLVGESPGFVPDQLWADRYRNGRFMGGDIANMAIGQGALLTTPVQMAQFMAAVGNGSYLPEAKLIKQVQDVRNNLVRMPKYGSPRRLNTDASVLNAVRQGMSDVVNEWYGTAKRARLTGNSGVKVAGKTGTGQWKIAVKQNVAWFAGFLPADDPEYAFAVLYEGRPGEKVAGGKNAAPLVSQFFSPIYDKKVKEERDKRAKERSELLAKLAEESERAAAERSRTEALAAEQSNRNQSDQDAAEQSEDERARMELLQQVLQDSEEL
ncbi:peptidoglycan D,D-transpeptidase FtsI family protein [Sulfuriroseicoccus oceanibius]|uniref:Beta-lactamase n=1 Tax=Sulfuriroseicoccus oceanibius TaxID=2707525 RepID=A0A6B3LA89_9BACT|nr:penicillin-binding transpeptidase domain-containing protein [Sulfuriroseicoccus oceanibius]QQL44039.1 hypothetical protein G3M56_009045 [Sulfuriroseicoccus oceanibius]